MSTIRPTASVQPLLRPADLGGLRLPNRVVMAPVTRARATNPGLVPTELHAAYYGERAGAGLIVTEGTWVSERAIGFVDVPGVYSEEQVAGWRRVTEVVHALGGRIVLQLWHTGAASHPDHLRGEVPAGPSAVDPREKSFTREGFKDTVTPREMTAADIARTVAEYGAAAANARRAGFDGVEVHAVGPYLIPQFLNPRLNRRTDAYGAGAAGRRRLLCEIVDAVAAPWNGRCVGVRLSPYWDTGDRFVADERTLAEYDALVTELGARPVAYLHLRGRDLAAPGGTPDFGAFARYRRLFGGPLIVNLGFGRESGNAVVEAGIADAVSFATHFIANPDLVTRFAMGRALAAGDPATYYTGGAAGYVDQPVSGTGSPSAGRG
ncbi:alkene reductase [Streptomyces albireticuli]|uniref:Alkene reductase n=1 Tax=Streptomyces albireticuli TaxID=1940 RepID=A0A2A2D9T9_9ACTN|nr:alkene reductase [Streptomyces albireticuli]MCD9141336.1 alkene reductase [Streptomyces albireticuli]MCD9160703.1 alkene reductase [Streptomyces albireticuli]MCD9191240.1 alkene reductase [Streptomyces albireticuli]PAU48130.1 alkene reductase [Streptomyces albireticuli]